jgi:hypothetical protein
MQASAARMASDAAAVCKGPELQLAGVTFYSYEQTVVRHQQSAPFGCCCAPQCDVSISHCWFVTVLLSLLQELLVDVSMLQHHGSSLGAEYAPCE